uniref:Uncharacterized protein n=1 Tax=Glossina palpalis gambiensis TaxID=67801 RepID=A0A1B0AW08_9MUSC
MEKVPRKTAEVVHQGHVTVQTVASTALLPYNNAFPNVNQFPDKKTYAEALANNNFHTNTLHRIEAILTSLLNINICPGFKLLESKLNLTILLRVCFPSKHNIKDKGVMVALIYVFIPIDMCNLTQRDNNRNILSSSAMFQAQDENFFV